MVTLYVDGEGCCFVSIPALAEDCEMSPDTVRRRLAWLESIGVISRTPQWIDAQGRRTSDGPGKRTSDLIKLLMPGVSPSNQQGSSPRLALRQPSHCGKGLISEPEPEQKEEGKEILIEVKCEEALRAWDEWGRQATGKAYPRNRRGGWYFPSQWPPGHGAEILQVSIGRKA
jgi:hypothetical protein